MLAFTNMLLLVGSLAVSLAILVPLTGALVRFRAHYNPKGLQLDPESGVQPHTGPVITSFFAMLVRVYRIEVRFVISFCSLYSDEPVVFENAGMARIVQGTQCVWFPANSRATTDRSSVPTLLSTTIVTLFLLLFLSESNLRHGTYSSPSTGVVGTLVYSLFAMLISLPETIITNR